MAPERILFRIDRFEVGQTVNIFDSGGTNVMFKRATVKKITASDVIVLVRNRMSKTIHHTENTNGATSSTMEKGKIRVS